MTDINQPSRLTRSAIFLDNPNTKCRNLNSRCLINRKLILRTYRRTPRFASAPLTQASIPLVYYSSQSCFPIFCEHPLATHGPAQIFSLIKCAYVYIYTHVCTYYTLYMYIHAYIHLYIQCVSLFFFAL